MLHTLTKLARALVDLWYPPWCAVCGGGLADGEAHLCRACTERMPLIKPPCCPRCSRPMLTRGGASHLCGVCRTRPVGSIARVCAAGLYDAGLKRLIHLYKYRRHQFLATALGDLLAARAATAGVVDGVDYIAAIPLHWTRERWRGFNQARGLAARVAHVRGTALLPARALQRTRRTTPQVGLDMRDRRENIKGAFSACLPALVRGRCIALVDDVLTTGATAEECARALVRAGAAEVRLLVLAR